MQVNTQEIESQNNPQEKLYFSGLVMYMLVYLHGETCWDYKALLFLLRIFAIFALIINFLFVCLKQFELKKAIFTLFSFILLLVVGLNAGFQKGENLLYECMMAFFLIFGAVGMDFRRILKVFLIVSGTFCFVTVMSSLIGIIENITDVSWTREDAIGSSGNHIRMSLGYGWPTNMANHVFFILLCYYYYIGRSLTTFEYILYIVLSLFIWYYTGSRLSSFSILFILLISLIQNKSWWKRVIYTKLIKYLFVTIIPILTFVSFYVTSAFDDSNIFWIAADILLTGRLGLGNVALNSAGIPLFGQFYQMYGSARDDGTAYNYVDSSYIQLLVIYGLVYTLMLLTAYVYICIRAFKKEDYSLLYYIILAGLSGLIAQHFIEMYMNPLPIALFTKVSSDMEIQDNC